MKKSLNEHITRTKELLATDPNNKFIKSYLSKLKSLKDVPDNRLDQIEKVINLFYKSLKKRDDEENIKIGMGIFALMVMNVQLAAIHDRRVAGNTTSADEKMLEKFIKRAARPLPLT